MKKVLVAMSGGVDSSVAAFLLKQNGYPCMGVTMKLFDNGDINIDREKSCCSLEDMEDARSVAFRLGIPYHIFNFKDDFEKKVVQKFISTYEQGGTPNPCIDCNRYLKFEKLFLRAQELGYDFVATGHYAAVEYDPQRARYLLKKSADETKDQSYVLYSMTQQQLAHALFPLGKYRKYEVRRIAEENGFINAAKKDSQDICFVPDGDYAAFIEKHTGKAYPKGQFIDSDGAVLGCHNGIIRYTVGQRKGLGISNPERLYVCKKDPKTNTVLLGTKDRLFSSEVLVHDINLISTDKIEKPLKITAKTRYNMKAQPATVLQTEEDTLKVIFDEPQRAVTLGQALVLYDNDIVVGGGTIFE